MRIARTRTSSLLSVSLVSLTTAAITSFCCTVFNITDEGRTLVGANEDWTTDRFVLWIQPPRASNHGMIVWDVDDAKKYPFAGFNDQGLFFDLASAPPPRPPKLDPGKETNDNTIYVRMLAGCSNVAQAIEFLGRFNISGLARHHIMVVDRSGDSAVIEAGVDGHAIIRKKGRYQVMENFSLAAATDSAAKSGRYAIAERMLAEEQSPSMDSLRAILRATRNSSPRYPTVLSSQIDLSTVRLRVFHKGNFDECLEIDARKEFQKGEHSFRLPDCFSSLSLGEPAEGEIITSNQVELTWRTTAPVCFLYVSSTLNFLGCEPRNIAPLNATAAAQRDYTVLMTNLAHTTTNYWKVLPAVQGDLATKSPVRTFRAQLSPMKAESIITKPMFFPKPIGDSWSKWMVGEWEGAGESDTGEGKGVERIEFALNGQFLICRGEAKITEMTPEHADYLKRNMSASDEEIERFKLEGYTSLQLFTIDQTTGEVVGYLFDSLRCIATGRGRREGNREVMEWVWINGHKSTRITERLSDDRMRVVQRTPMPDGSVMEEKGESIRRKQTASSSTVPAGDEPKIIQLEKFFVMGTLTRITPGTESGEKFGSIWSEFEAHREQIKPQSTDQKYYGVSFAVGGVGGFDYVAGMAVAPGEKIPAGLVVREVPAATYAVFACPLTTIGQTKRFIFGEWRSKSGRQIDGSAPTFEQYPTAEDAESLVLIHIPLKTQL